MFNFDRMTLEEAKTYYHQQARANHPDFDGNLETMQKLNAAYAQFVAGYARQQAYTRQAEAHEANRKSAADYHDMNDLAAEIAATIEAILRDTAGYEIDLELCGLWLWITGDTKPVKEILKANAFKWSHAKTAWYKAFVPSFSRGKYSLDQIRETYGNQKFNKREEDQDQQPRRQYAQVPA